MESLKISKLGGPGSGFHIEGFPDAVKVAMLDGSKARRLTHLALHRADLLFARECLSALAGGHREPIRSALWISALVCYFKCFGQSNARGCLNASKIYAHNEIALESFTFFKNMRDKHYVHDANPFVQAIPGALVNAETQERKIAKIVTFSARADILDQDTFTNLRLLIEGAERWVVRYYDELCEVLTKELEQKSHPELLAFPDMKYSKPEPTDAGTERK